MSIHLMSLVWEIDFPTQTQKMTALKLADYASEDGSGVYPSNQLLAKQVACDKRSIQHVMKSFRGIGLIDLVRSGGKGERSTNEWRLCIDLVVELAMGQKRIEGNYQALEVVENVCIEGGENTSPSVGARVKFLASRVKPASRGGEAHTTQTLLNHQIESVIASADARDGSRSSPAGKSIVSLTLEPRDSGWSAWMEFLSPSFRELAEARGSIEVSKRWPDDDAVLHTRLLGKPKGLTETSKRMTGEAS